MLPRDVTGIGELFNNRIRFLLDIFPGSRRVVTQIKNKITSARNHIDSSSPRCDIAYLEGSWRKPRTTFIPFSLREFADNF